MDHRQMLAYLRMEEFRLAAERERILRASISRRRKVRAARRRSRAERPLGIIPVRADYRAERPSAAFKS